MRKDNIELVHINRRTFRVPLSSFKKNNKNNKNKNYTNENIINNNDNIDNSMTENNSENDEVNEMIEKINNLTSNNLEKNNDNELLKAYVPCDKEFRGMIIGKKGAMKKRIISESGVKNIFVPLSKDNSDIVIEADNQEALDIAEKKILEIINKAKNKPVDEKPTHFLSLPLVDVEFIKKVEEIYNFIKEDAEDKNFVNSILIPLKALHLTIAVMTLKDEDEVNKAIQILRSCSSTIYDILRTHSAVLKISGLAVMKGSVKKARVVYCRILEEQSYDLVMEASNFIIKKFEDAGLMNKDNHRELLLHSTILNTIYSKKRSEFYDASKLFDKFGNFDFGNVLIPNVSLNQMGTRSEDGYKCLAKVSFP